MTNRPPSKLLLVTKVANLEPQEGVGRYKALADSVRINRAAPVTGASTINTQQASVLAALNVKKPAVDARLAARAAAPCQPGSADALDLSALLVGAAEAVGEEGRQGHLLLPDEALLWQLSLAEQIDGGAHAGRGGDLDRRQR